MINGFDLNTLGLNFLTQLPSGSPGNPFPAVTASPLTADIDQLFADDESASDEAFQSDDLLDDIASSAVKRPGAFIA